MAQHKKRLVVAIAAPFAVALLVIGVLGLRAFILEPRTYANQVVSDRPLVLQGDEVLTITDAHYVQRNNIILKDRAQLIIRDSLFEHRQDYSLQYTLNASGDAQVVVEASQIRSSNWLNWNFSDNASLVLDGVDQRFSGIWHSFAGKARARVANSKFHGTLGGEASFDIENSPDTFIELVFPAGAVVDEELPKMMTDYSFPNAGDSNIRLSLKVRNSMSTSWGITVNPRSDVTIRDTGPLIVTLAIGEPWHGVTAELDNLRATLYEDRTWRVDDTSLRLIHVRTGRWSPIVGGDNTLIVRDSDLADNAFSWGNAKIVIENSTASFLRAQDNVQMTVRDSTIRGDVVAVNNGRITLINTKVDGKTVREGNGQITGP